MKVRVSTIPNTGMKIQGVLTLAPLNARLAEGKNEEELYFEAPPEVDLTLKGGIGATEVKGVVIGTVKQGCGSCGEIVPHEVVGQVDWTLQSRDDPKYRSGKEDLDDPSIVYYDGDHVDLENSLQEALIIELSPFWHPERTEDEQCTVCDRDCSQKVAKITDEVEQKRPLGLLFEKALKQK